MSLAEMKAQIRELSPFEREELMKYLAILDLEQNTDWQEKAFQELRASRFGKSGERLYPMEEVLALHEKLSEQGR